MSIRIVFKNKNENDMWNKLNDFHKALKGSPGYVNNEIALCELENNRFVLVVGNDNQDDVDLEI